MITVLIADDDFWTLEGLKHTIDWETLGFCIIAEAPDADTAYELFAEKRPQLVITDICMGATSGLDLVEKIHLEAPETEFIILSGYSQFDYAKKSFENGSSAYLLKPVDNDELTNAILSVKAKIQSRTDSAKLMEAFSGELPKLKAIFYNDIISGETNSDAIAENARLYGIDPFAPYTLANVGLSQPAISDTDSSAAPGGDLLKLIRRFDFDRKLVLDCWAYSKYNVLILFRSGNDVSEAILSLGEYLRKKSDSRLTIGVSTDYDYLGDLNAAFLEADEALSFKSLYGNGSVIFFRNIFSKKTQAVSIDNSAVENMVGAVLSVNYVHAMRLADDMFDAFKKYDRINIAELQSSVAELITVILQNIYVNSRTIEDVFSGSFRPFIEISKYETVDDIHDFFVSVLNKIFENPNLYLDCGYNPHVQEIISYITQNYDKQLSVKSVAEAICLSPSYLMHVFKQETGKTFHAYLTEYRIKMAAQLLKTHRYKVYEVADMVGFCNTEHFGKVFKSVMGCSPTKY